MAASVVSEQPPHVATCLFSRKQTETQLFPIFIMAVKQKVQPARAVSNKSIVFLKYILIN